MTVGDALEVESHGKFTKTINTKPKVTVTQRI